MIKMAKRLVAVTNIKHNGNFIKFGEVLDHKLFTQEQLKRLYDAGAIRLEVDSEIIPEDVVAAVTVISNEPESVKVTESSKTTSVPKVTGPSVVKSTVKSEDTNGKSNDK